MSYRDDLSGLTHRAEALEREAAGKSKELAEARRLLDQARTRARMPVLDNISVAAPCNADWNKMVGDDHTRFCGQCEKNVYDLSSLTRAAAEALLVEKEGKLCVRYFQRKDGTILTADCPDGLARRRRRNRVIAISFGAMSAVAAAASALFPRVPMMGEVKAPCELSTEVGTVAPSIVDVTGEVAPPRNIGIPKDHYTEVKGGAGARPTMGKPVNPKPPSPVAVHPVMGRMAPAPKMGGLAVTK